LVLSVPHFIRVLNWELLRFSRAIDIVKREFQKADKNGLSVVFGSADSGRI